MTTTGRVLIALTALTCMLSTCQVEAFHKPADDDFPQDFDHRRAVPVDMLLKERADSAVAFSGRFGNDIVLRYGDLSGKPLFVYRPGSVLGIVPTGDRISAVKLFLRGRDDLFGLTPAEIDSLDPSAVYTSFDNGITHMRFLQRIDGISVFRGQILFNLDPAGGIINIGGEYFAGLQNGTVPEVNATQALQAAASGIGVRGDLPAIASEQTGGERLTVFEKADEYLEPPTARLMLLPEGAGRSRLVWETILWENVTGWDNMYRVLVDAASGEPVLRELMTLYAGPAGPDSAVGLVFEKDPISGPQVSLSFAGDPVASPSYWVSDGQTETRGNNIISRADSRGTNSDATNPLADGGKQYEFNFVFENAYEETGSISIDRDAAITNAFYLGNAYHDYYYDLGFDEAAGNHQDDNFGRGGLGGDHVNVDVQDGASFTWFRNNANWNPTNDGSPPRTNYYLWEAPYERRDGAFDGTVIWHEFTHGLSTRLVGGPGTQCLNGAQGGGMGEGWSDWFAVSYFSDETEDPAGPVVVGEYVTGRSDRGIRRYPYAYDMSLSPLTYEDLCDNGGCEVHNEGEIWAAVLWDIRHDLILAHGYDEGRRRSERLNIDAMKLSPCSPNMVVMRDAIYQADENRYSGEDICLLRSAFTRRGFGAGAWSNGTGDDAGADFSLILPVDESLGFGSDKITLDWTEMENSIAYTVVRGTFGSESGSNTFDNGSCLGESSVPQYLDSELPSVPGNGFFYLVASDDGCVRSGYGTGSDGLPRTVSDCP